MHKHRCREYIHMRTYAHICTHMHTCTCTHMHTYVCMCMCAYVCICVHMCACVCALCICACVHEYTKRKTRAETEFKLGGTLREHINTQKQTLELQNCVLYSVFVFCLIVLSYALSYFMSYILSYFLSVLSYVLSYFSVLNIRQKKRQNIQYDLNT